MSPDRYKKSLDNRMRQWYTTRVKKTMFDIKMRIQDEDRALFQKDILSRVNTTLLQKTSLPAVIAGGAPRDAVLGNVWQDIDVFVDTTDLSKEEEQDTLLLLAMDLTDEAKSWPELAEDGLGWGQSRVPLLRLDVGDYAKSGPNKDKGLVIYDAPWMTVVKDELGVGIHFQVIGRKDRRIADPMKFVEEDFDWPLCKTFVDTASGEIVLSKAFLEMAESRIFVADTIKTYDRANGWVYSRRLDSKEWKIRTSAKKEIKPTFSWDYETTKPGRWVQVPGQIARQNLFVDEAEAAAFAREFNAQPGNI